jgi:DNA-binding transcriptional LysR family regulator
LWEESFAVLPDPSTAPNPVDLDTYLALRHVFVSTPGDFYGAVDRALAAIGRRREVGLVLSHFTTVPALLRGRPLYAAVPAVAARHMAAAHGLACAPLPLRSPTFELSLQWHERSRDDRLHIWFRALVGELARSLRHAPGPHPRNSTG